MLNAPITSSPAPSFPASLRYIQNGDALNTGNHQIQAEDVAQAVGHLKGSKAELTETDPVTFADLTISGTANVKLASRSVTRQLALTADTTSGNWARTATPRGSWHNTAAGGTLDVHLERLPHGQVLTSIAIRWDPAAGHGALPVFPSIELWTIDAAGVESSVGSATDSQPNVPSYEAPHSITISGLLHAIDLTLYRYVLVVTGETGANFVANAKITQCSVTCACTSYSEF